MSEWNRSGRNDDMRRHQSEGRTRDWESRDRGQRGGGEHETRSFYGSDPGQRGGSDYGPENRSGQSYARSGQGYGGQGYGQGYGGPGHSGQSYGSGRSYGQPGETFGRQRFGEGSYGGQGYGGQGYGGGQDYRQDYRQGGGGERFGQTAGFGDPNDEVRRVADGDTGPGLFGGGQHRGRGPKNYTRSDERIREDVNDRLSDDPHLDASEIEVQVSSCEVTLTGTVDSREDRRRAEDLVEQVSGVKHVQNNLRVQAQGSSASSGAASMTGAGAGSATGQTVGDRSSMASGTTSTGGTTGKTN